jgi:LPS-assembly lipoprotein
MSSRSLTSLAIVAAFTLLAACTVRPLYSDGVVEAGAAAGLPGRLASVSVKAVDTRVGLQVRNHLIFLLNGGAGEPASPAYTIDTGVTVGRARAATVQLTRDSEPTAAVVTVTSNYKIIDTATGLVVASGRRSMNASYDVPRQEYAALQAAKNAEDRAAREVAELLRHAIAQDLQRLAATG